MSLIDRVLFYAKQIADDNRFVYGRWDSPYGNGSGAVSVPYHMDCCIYISYAIYLAMGWTWYNQPYGYYWPHPDQSGYDYFLTNTMGCSKYTWPNVPGGLQPGDIIITTPALGHTFMIYDNNTIADNSPGYSLNNQVSLKPIYTYGSSYYWYVYRLPGGSSGSDYMEQAQKNNASFSDGVRFVWNVTDYPYTCKITGTATAERAIILFQGDTADMPFIKGKTYRVKYSTTGSDKSARLRVFSFDHASWTNANYKVAFREDGDFVIPQDSVRMYIRLVLPANMTANETVTIEIYAIESLAPPLPGADDNIKRMPLWMMLNPFI